MILSNFQKKTNIQPLKPRCTSRYWPKCLICLDVWVPCIQSRVQAREFNLILMLPALKLSKFVHHFATVHLSYTKHKEFFLSNPLNSFDLKTKQKKLFLLPFGSNSAPKNGPNCLEPLYLNHISRQLLWLFHCLSRTQH